MNMEQKPPVVSSFYKNVLHHIAIVIDTVKFRTKEEDSEGKPAHLVKENGQTCPHAVASVGAAMATGIEASSDRVTSIRQSPSLAELSLAGPTEA